MVINFYFDSGLTEGVLFPEKEGLMVTYYTVGVNIIVGRS